MNNITQSNGGAKRFSREIDGHGWARHINLPNRFEKTYLRERADSGSYNWISRLMRSSRSNNRDNADDIIDLRSLPQFRPIRDNAFVDRLRNAVPFDHVSVSGLDLDGYRLGETTFHLESDVPPALAETYLSDKLYEADPLLRYVIETQCVALESLVYPKRKVPVRFRQLAENFSIRNRTVFPVKRNGLVCASVGFMRREPFTEDEIEFLRQIARPLYTSVVGPLVERFAAESSKLTEGEIICLRLAAEGMTTAEIAEGSKFQAATVDSYLKLATKNLVAKIGLMLL